MRESKVNLTRGFGLLENFLSKKRAAKANSLIPMSLTKGRILDVGCGSYPYFLSTSLFKERFGIDPSLDASLLNSEQKKLKLKKVRIGNSILPFEDNYFDAITMLAVFEHIDYEKLPFVLREIKRLLKRGGTFVITTPAPWSDRVLHLMAYTGLISKEEIHEHKHHFSRKDIEKILNDSGFSEDKVKSGFFEGGLNMWFSVRK